MIGRVRADDWVRGQIASPARARAKAEAPGSGGSGVAGDVEALQRAAGNRAVSALLGARPSVAVQRWSLSDITSGLANVGTELLNKGKAAVHAVMEERGRSATGAQADEYLNATPIVRRFIKEKVESRNLTAAGSVRFDDEETFMWEYVAFSVELEQGNAERAGRPFDVDAEIEAAKEKSKSSAGFTRDDVIHINTARARAGTVIHESIHLYGSDRFRRDVGKEIDEGATEYFTRVVCRLNLISRSEVYVEERGAVEKLVAHLPRGEEALADALFDGDMNYLRVAFDPAEGSTADKVAEGHRRFKQWRGHMNREEFAQANALLD